MVSNIILVCFFISLNVFLYIFLIKVLSPYLSKKNEIKEIETKNNLYEIYMKLDNDLMENEIDKFIKKYLDKYILYNITSQNIIYVRKDEVHKMIKSLTSSIYLDLSDLYIFYIKNLIRIDNDEDVLGYIHNKVEDAVLVFITEYNKSNE